MDHNLITNCVTAYISFVNVYDYIGCAHVSLLTVPHVVTRTPS